LMPPPGRAAKMSVLAIADSPEKPGNDEIRDWSRLGESNPGQPHYE
jgi:hypothetical protein